MAAPRLEPTGAPRPSRRPRPRPRLAACLAAAVAVAAGCSPEPERWDAVDLAALRHTAAWESAQIPVGAAAGEPFLGDGWGLAEDWQGQPVRWSLGPRATLLLHVSEPRDLRLRAVVAPHGEQPGVRVRIGERVLATWSLPAGFSEQVVEVPADALTSGQNVVEILPSSWDAPAPDGEGDRRRLAIAWTALQVEGAGSGRPAVVDGAKGTFRLPPSSAVRWAVAPAAEYRLTIAAASSPSPTASELTLEMRWDDGSVAEQRVEADGDEVRWEVRSHDPASPALLSIRTGAAGGATLRGPRLDLRAAGAAAAVAAATPGPPRPAPAPGGPRPDVILYLVDTLRADRLGPQADGRSLTPALDRLAAQSVVFERAVAQAPWTRPAVASILTGLLPPEHTAVDRESALPPSVETIAEILRAEGYATAAIIGNGNVASEFGFAQGFDTFVEPYKLEEFAVSANGLQETALDWLARRDRTRPAFLLILVVEPHHPYKPPPEVLRRIGRTVVDHDIGSARRLARMSVRQEPPTPRELADLQALYDGNVALLDERAAPFLTRLAETGDLDRSVFVFVSDHGEEFWEHGALTHGERLNTEQLDIPFFVRLPGPSRPGRRVAEVVQQVDIVPTLLELCGVREGPRGLTGRSLVDLLAGERPELRRTVFSHLDADGWQGTAVTDDVSRLIRTTAGLWGTGTELYDTVADRGERNNLAAARPAGVGWRLHDLLRWGARRLADPTSADPEELTKQQLRALGYFGQ